LGLRPGMADAIVPRVCAVDLPAPLCAFPR
jgi:hypothetical protein